jgi:putative SOS response-associated peptidase YedK
MAPDARSRRKGAPPPQPYLIRRRDGQPMALAGLWEHWVGPNGEEVETACIVTTFANGLISALHDRMPVILEPEQFDTWLDCSDEDPSAAARLMRPAAEDVLEFFPIDAALNKASADGPELQVQKGPVERAEHHTAPLVAAAPSRPVQGDLFG